MPVKVFVLKSLLIQNTIMAVCLGIVLFLLYRGLRKKNVRQIALFCVWTGLILWFFNSALWGFSAVSIENRGIKLDYGFLSFKNIRQGIESGSNQ